MYMRTWVSSDWRRPRIAQEPLPIAAMSSTRFEIDFEPGTTTLPFGGVDATYTRDTPWVSEHIRR